MRIWRIMFALLIIGLMVTTGPNRPVLAARGIPGSAEFGFGAHLDLSGTFGLDAVSLASNLELDWLAIDCPWLDIAPQPGVLNWTQLDPILQAAARSHQTVMLSLTRAPDWALSPQGPDPAKTAQFVLQILQRYSTTIQAVELFPAANTAPGWGRPPSPQAYFNTWSGVQNAIKNSKSPVLLVAGGLVPTPTGSSPAQEINDLVFLQELYTIAKTTLPIISMQANNLTGEPLQAPEKAENRVLRHYEEIRAVMLKNKQEAGLIWITHLAPPNGTLAPADRRYQDLSNQASWMDKAYDQMKSQLYIGVTFLGQINPSDSDNHRDAADTTFSLLLPAGDYHPFYRSLRDLIAVDRSNVPHLIPGRTKSEPLKKSSQSTK